jgi:hypothetical protein
MTHDWPSWLIGELDDDGRRAPIQERMEIEEAKTPRILKYITLGSVRVRRYSNLADVLRFMYPNMLISDEEKRQAAITLESLYVFLKGHKPSEDSPLYGIKDKSIAKRVQRFLKAGEEWKKLEDFIQESVDHTSGAEARDYLRESYDQAAAEDDQERLHQLAENFGVVSDYVDDEDDDVVRLWRNRLNE